MLTQEELTAFQRDGWVCRRAMFQKRDIEGYLSDISRRLSTYLVHLGVSELSIHRELTTFEKASTILRTAYLSDFVLYREIISELSRLTFIEEIAREELVLGIAKELLQDSAVELHHHSLIVSMPRQPWPLIHWHQDAYASERLHLILNIPLVPTSAANGGLKVMTARHSGGLLEHMPRAELELKRHLHISPTITENWRGEQLNLNAGDAVFMHRFLPHAGGINGTNHPRLVVAVRYTSRRLSPVKH